jgi:hypothetical protein
MLPVLPAVSESALAVCFSSFLTLLFLVSYVAPRPVGRCPLRRFESPALPRPLHLFQARDHHVAHNFAQQLRNRDKTKRLLYKSSDTGSSPCFGLPKRQKAASQDRPTHPRKGERTTCPLQRVLAHQGKKALEKHR